MSKKLFYILPLFLFFVAAIPARAAVVINEIYPKADPSTNEWVELYNTDPSTSVSLNQWKLDHISDTTSFILNASDIIQPNGFLLLTGSQTNISFNINGDTVRLFDDKGNQVDSQSYPGTLGYNTSMGRVPDGGNAWSVCTTATPNAANNCPMPSPTATPMPTPTPYPTPTSTPYPTATPTLYPTPTLTQQVTSIPTQETFGVILGSTVMPTIQPTIHPTITAVSSDLFQIQLSKSEIGYTLLGVAAGALSCMLYLFLHNRSVKKKS